MNVLGLAPDGKIIGRFNATGVRSPLFRTLQAMGLQSPVQASTMPPL